MANNEFQFEVLKKKNRIQSRGCCLSVVACAAASASVSLLTMTEVFVGGHII